MKPAISILIRTFNSAATLPQVLSLLDLQTADEVIIVDSGSNDSTLEIAKKNGARIIIAEKPFNYSRSLNLGFQAAQNQWVLVLSSHCIPQSGNLLAAFREAVPKFSNAVAVAYGECLLVKSKESPAGNILFADKTASAVQRQQVVGGNPLALYRHDFWVRQPFNEKLPTAEDLEWVLKAFTAGAMAARVPQAKVLYRNQGSMCHMFCKGWKEACLARKLAGGSPMSFFGLLLNFASLFKKWLTAKMPAMAILRHMAHALGVYWSFKFDEREP